MELDVIEYSKALDAFLQRMAKIPAVVHEDVKQSLEPLCRVLRIAKIDLIYYKTMRDEKEQNNGETVVFLENDLADEGRLISQRELTEMGNVAIYRAWPFKDGSGWSEEELVRIRQLLTMMFIFNGRVRVLEVAERLTFYDQQMDIYNLSYFMKLGEMLIRKGKIGKFCACYFNLKRFSVVNQRIGRDNGTRVMLLFIKMLKEAMQEQGYVFRIGGDNFLLLFPKDMIDVMKECLSGTEIVFGEHPSDHVYLNTSAGMYMVSDSCQKPTDIMDRVTLAFQAAKTSADQSIVLFSEELVAREHYIKNLESMFPVALRNEEFKVYYQPKVSLDDYSLAGAEALCRWEHDGKLIPPGDFVPVMERSQIICELDFYMIDHVCKDIRRWLDEGRKCVRISVNLSRRHLGDMNLLRHIMEIIDQNNVPHEYLEIELTETTTEVDFQVLKALVTGLGDRGIHTSIDDFGMGFSSLNLIRQAPWNVLKIDKCFLPDGDQSDMKRQTMLKYMISMFQDMGLECIVEGVETEEHVALLRENHCSLAQGFYFDFPLPVEEFEKRLESVMQPDDGKNFYINKHGGSV